MSRDPVVISRRAALAGTGALVFSYASAGRLLAQDAGAPQAGASPSPASPLPGSLKQTPLLDAWIRIDADGTITALTGKAELGQGIKTALTQIAAEQLDVDFNRIVLQSADTALTPNEGYTAGSHSLQDSGTALLNAAAQVRQLLIAEAAKRAGASIDMMKTKSGAVVAPDGRRFRYGELVSGQMLHVQAASTSRLVDPDAYTVMNRNIPRIDIPAKVTGGAAFVQDLRPPGMVHARVIRPPSYGAQLVGVDDDSVKRLPGFIRVVRDGSFLAVVAEREFQAIEAMRVLAAATRWQETAQLPDDKELSTYLGGLSSQDIAVLDRPQSVPAGARRLSATYSRPYLAHGSIAPSCAVAHFDDDALTVWTHTQGVYPDRDAIAEMLQMPKEKVRCIHSEGAGCYGHNGADDAAADAALIARAVPGRPVRVQWTREQEHAWEPYGPAMLVKIDAALDDGGGIVHWDYGVWSNTHSTRPGSAGSLLAARSIAQSFPEPPPKPIPMPEGGGDRNSIPIYRLPGARVINHFLPTMPVRVSALRSLGAHMNVFAIESFMDELAAAADADPVDFRLKHLDDPRAREVISAAAARFGWQDRKRSSVSGRGQGFAFARYKNLAAYCAVACEVDVDPDTGQVQMRRAVAAVDAGQAVNPDGIANQIEGAILQSMSWSLYERVAFDERRITSVDWASYPILRFSAVPETMEVQVVNRPGMPFLGAGEAAQGPAAAALANAIADATGKRFRDLPISQERVKAALAS